MVFVFIALWTIAAILLITNPKSESTRWAALTAFTGGGGGLSRTVTETILPYLHLHQVSLPIIDAFLFKLHMAGSFMNHNGLPYCFLMYAICTSGFFKQTTRKTLAIVLPLPIVVMFLITPMTPDIELNFKILFSWCVPYLLTGLFLLVYSYAKEKNTLIKKSRAVSNLVAFPPIIFQIFANYTFKAFFQFNEVWRYMPFVITVLLVSFILFGLKYGVLGVRLKFEKDRLDRTMRATTSGTSALNHTIKGQISTIKLVAERIKYIAVTNGQTEIDKQIDSVMDSTDHMLAMVARIQSQLQDIEIKESPHNLVEILETSLTSLAPYLEKQNIHVIKDVHCNLDLLCDSVHLQEVFTNLLVNAMEAMNPGGQIYISIYETKRHLILELKDNGAGIAEEDLPRIIDPFFSTKNRNLNFGLGLSYCYNVMQKHQGSLDIQSEKNIGTTIVLQFSKKKAVTKVDVPRHGEVAYEQNQSFTS